MTETEIIEQFKRFVSEKMPQAEEVDIGRVNPIFGGASRQTYSLELKYVTEGKPVSEQVILRREFESGIIETNVNTEFEAYQAFYATDVPVPRVLWIGVDENPSLQTIQTRVENELYKIRFPKEQRKFHPHLTLGRVKGPHNIGPVIQMLEQHKENDFGRMTVNRITFFQSTLKPTGAEYTILSEHRLQ